MFRNMFRVRTQRNNNFFSRFLRRLGDLLGFLGRQRGISATSALAVIIIGSPVVWRARKSPTLTEIHGDWERKKRRLLNWKNRKSLR
nr:hypothetical protein Itr_chr01CG20240 [Ipomoea trifida]